MISFASVSLAGPMPKAKRKKSALDIEFGYGRHGSNVRHYIPEPEEIESLCARIRDLGFTDDKGVWHGPWDEAECRSRAGRGTPSPVEITAIEISWDVEGLPDVDSNERC